MTIRQANAAANLSLCTIECKKLSGVEVCAIIELKESFDQPIQELRQALDVCNSDCPNLHFTKHVNKVVIDLESDPLVSSDDGGVSQCI